jgi:hypothetical protein
MKLGIIIQKQPSLIVLSNVNFSLKAAAAVSHELAKLSPILTNAQAATMELYKKHGVLSTDGQQYTVSAENKPAFDAEMMTLLDTEVELTLVPVNMANPDHAIKAVTPAQIIHLASLDGFVLSNMCRMLGVVVQSPVLTVVGGTDVAVSGEQVAPVDVAPIANPDEPTAA